MTRKKIKRKRIAIEDLPPKKETKLEYQQTTPNVKRRRRRRQSRSRITSNFVPVIFGIVIIVIVGFILAPAPNPDLNNGEPTSPIPDQNNSNPVSPTPEQNNSNPVQYQIPYSVTTIHGELIELSTYQGKGLILYFSGVSCYPCQMHLPYLVDAYNYYNTTGKIAMVSLDIQGHSIDTILAWEQNNGITWKVCKDSGLTLATHFSVYSMPTLVVCDENGYELNRYVATQNNQTIWAIFESAIN